MKIDEIIKSDELTISALLALYGYQTVDEQSSESTRGLNGIGFNRIDAPILSSISQFYIKNNFLTEKQLALVKRSIKKYHMQLEGIELIPVELKKREVKQSTTSGNWEKKARLDGEYIFLKFYYPKGDNRFFEVLGKVKSLSWRTWDPNTKEWKVRRSLETLKKLHEWEFKFDVELQKWYDSVFSDSINKDLDVPIELTLFPFQKDGVAFIDLKNGRALIGDEMGLGKTVQAIGWTALYPRKRPVLIICPSNVKLNWKKEIKKCLPRAKVELVEGRNYAGAMDGDYIICNYDIVSANREKILSTDFKVLILDECHYIKNYKAKRTEIITEIGKRIEHVICLSGTPIVNRPVEFFTALNLIRPDLFPSYWEYVKKYCPSEGWTKWQQTNGSSNEMELHNNLIQTLMLRRLKEDVLSQLPKKRRQVIPIECDLTEYNKAEADLVAWMKEKGYSADRISGVMSAEIITRIEYLKQIAVKEKYASIVDWIENYLSSGRKLVVFCTHKATVDFLMETFKGITVRLDGRDNAVKKQQAVDRFQTDPQIKLFIGNIKAAGIAITLTAAQDTCFIELGWTPGDHDQAEDRVHRIGQEAESVTAFYLIAANTIEEEIAELIDTKRGILTQILDGKMVEDEKLLTHLLTNYFGNKYQAKAA